MRIGREQLWAAKAGDDSATPFSFVKALPPRLLLVKSAAPVCADYGYCGHDVAVESRNAGIRGRIAFLECGPATARVWCIHDVIP